MLFHLKRQLRERGAFPGRLKHGAKVTLLLFEEKKRHFWRRPGEGLKTPIRAPRRLPASAWPFRRSVCGLGGRLKGWNTIMGPPGTTNKQKENDGNLLKNRPRGAAPKPRKPRCAAAKGVAPGHDFPLKNAGRRSPRENAQDRQSAAPMDHQRIPRESPDILYHIHCNICNIIVYYIIYIIYIIIYNIVYIIIYIILYIL